MKHWVGYKQWTLGVGLLAAVLVWLTPALAAAPAYPYAHKPCVWSPHAVKGGKANWCANFVWGSKPKDTTAANIVSPYGYHYRNCTDYVAWRLNGQGVKPELYKGLGNAKTWAVRAAEKGIKVDTQPTVGSVGVRTAGKYGHVAYVEAVYPNGTIKVSQYNNGADGEYSEQVGLPLVLGFSAFIHFVPQPTRPVSKSPTPPVPKPEAPTRPAPKPVSQPEPPPKPQPAPPVKPLPSPTKPTTQPVAKEPPALPTEQAAPVLSPRGVEIKTAPSAIPQRATELKQLQDNVVPKSTKARSPRILIAVTAVSRRPQRIRLAPRPSPRNYATRQVAKPHAVARVDSAQKYSPLRPSAGKRGQVASEPPRSRPVAPRVLAVTNPATGVPPRAYGYRPWLVCALMVGIVVLGVRTARVVFSRFKDKAPI